MSKGAKDIVEAYGPYRISKTKAEIEVDVDSFGTPNRTYAAQTCRIERLGGAHVAYFGQLGPSRRLASLIGIQLNDEALADFHATLREDFRGNVRGLANRYEAVDLLISDDQADPLETDRMFTVNASLARVVISSYGAQVDWYDLAPRQIRLLNQRKFDEAGFPAPVVTLAMSTRLLQTFITEVDKHVDAMKNRAALPVAGTVVVKKEPV